MKSVEIRESFLKFFEGKGHTRVKSSSLIPAADPTLMFTAAGMVQFKDCFLGATDPGYRRATTAQKCVRAGGKHNDLENVGFTARHHTFFEMLGNFSFGDYFKKDAIAFAWEMLTKTWGLPADRLRITVFREDDEAEEIWKSIGIRKDWIERLDEKDNFWAAGDTGPCGPCTEIYYDWGDAYASVKNGTPGTDSTRFVEIWNLDYMQYNRDASGKLENLPKPSVDTGSGLERVTAALQGKYSNYDTDLFQPIIQAIARSVGKPYGAAEESDVSMRVIADHLRAGTFLIADGVVPSNEGRGYVLRRILRRAIRHGKKLGQDRPFIFELAKTVADEFGRIYPEVVTQHGLVKTLLQEEEAKFHETLDRGMGLLEETIGDVRKRGLAVIPGDVAFKLYDTFGFPFDLIEVIAREQSLTVDSRGFDGLMEKQRSLSTFQKGGKSHLEKLGKVLDAKRSETKFLGYDGDGCHGTGKALVVADADGNEVPKLATGAEGFVVFDQTPFYAESGGQIGDKGTIIGPGVRAAVEDTSKIQKMFVHHVKVEQGALEAGKGYTLDVDEALRKRTRINHTATHLLHAALRKVLGDRVKQAGSLVDPQRLRFDFTFPRGVTPEERVQIETMVNEQVRRGSRVVKQEMSYDDAIKSGALAFFDEKYGDRVRVIRVEGDEAPFSIEFCGGTHLDNIGDIGFVKVLSESSVASGVRRLEAITATEAMRYLTERESVLKSIELKLNVGGEAALQKIESLQKKLTELERENEKLKLKSALGASTGGDGAPSLHDRAELIGGVRVVAEHATEASPKLLRTLVDQVRDKLKDNAIVALAAVADGKAALCVGLTKDLVGRYDASKLIQPLAKEVGGTGGGRPDFAQAGGSDPTGIPRAFATLKEWLKANA